MSWHKDDWLRALAIGGGAAMLPGLGGLLGLGAQGSSILGGLSGSLGTGTAGAAAAGGMDAISAQSLGSALPNLVGATPAQLAGHAAQASSGVGAMDAALRGAADTASGLGGNMSKGKLAQMALMQSMSGRAPPPSAPMMPMQPGPVAAMPQLQPQGRLDLMGLDDAMRRRMMRG